MIIAILITFGECMYDLLKLLNASVMDTGVVENRAVLIASEQRQIQCISTFRGAFGLVIKACQCILLGTMPILYQFFCSRIWMQCCYGIISAISSGMV